MNSFNFLNELKNFQGQMGDMQEKLKDLTATGSSGGDMVKVTANGLFEVLDVSISEICVDPRDVKMLEDLVKAALVDATLRVREKIKAEAKLLPGTLNMPPGFMGG